MVTIIPGNGTLAFAYPAPVVVVTVIDPNGTWKLEARQSIWYTLERTAQWRIE